MSKISTFADRFMRLINGQQPLPQSIFRNFLSEVEDVLTEADNNFIRRPRMTGAPTSGNLAAIDSEGNLVDSQVKATDVVTEDSFSFDTDTLTIVVGGHTYSVSATEVTSAGEE